MPSAHFSHPFASHGNPILTQSSSASLSNTDLMPPINPGSPILHSPQLLLPSSELDISCLLFIMSLSYIFFPQQTMQTRSTSPLKDQSFVFVITKIINLSPTDNYFPMAFTLSCHSPLQKLKSQQRNSLIAVLSPIFLYYLN